MRNARFALASAAALVISGVAMTSVGANAASRSAVAQGAASAVTSNSTVMGDTPVNQPVPVSMILNTRNANRLAQYIQSTVTPGNP